MQDTRSIRLSQEDWNNLLLAAIKNGYPNRTEYIRAMIQDGATARVTGNALWPNIEPEALPDQAVAAIVAVRTDHRLTIKEIVSKVSEKTRAKWETDKWKHEAMLKQLLDEYSDAVMLSK